jgi:rfaE bifunctional protein nucleotidyltransferase chain/domain
MDVDEKVKSLGDLASIVRSLKRDGKIIVQAHGVFDLIHPGHVRHLTTAKRQGDILVVTITRDKFVNKGPGRPVFNQQLRAESLAALQAVDYVSLTDTPTAVPAIQMIEPDVYVKGTDYANAENDLTGGINDEEEAVKLGGGRIHFTDEITFSSSTLINSHFPVYSEDAAAFLREFRQRFSSEDVISAIDRLQGLKVLVIGDAIIDEYHYCQSMGKSAKELLVSTKYLYDEAFAGGILAVANHIAGFCNQVDMVTCLGQQDSREDFIRGHLLPNVNPTFLYRSDGPTVIKRRFVEPAFLSKMFQVVYINDQPLPGEVQDQLMEHLTQNLPKYDVVVVADYGHGFLGPRAIEALASGARFLAVNAQTNSANGGYNLVTKYPRADYVCIDEQEFRLAMHDRTTPVMNLLETMGSKMDYRTITITRGHRSTITYNRDAGNCQIPIFSPTVVDRMGAGDAFLSVTAPCVAAGLPLDLAGFIGNAVGAIAVGIVGNKAAVERVPLLKFVTTLLK